MKLVKRSLFYLYELVCSYIFYRFSTKKRNQSSVQFETYKALRDNVILNVDSVNLRSITVFVAIVAQPVLRALSYR